MFGRKKNTELTQQHLVACKKDRRQRELLKDPSTIPGLTQTELNDVINTGTISSAKLRQIL
jgi:hypothetical protein